MFRSQTYTPEDVLTVMPALKKGLHIFRLQEEFQNLDDTRIQSLGEQLSLQNCSMLVGPSNDLRFRPPEESLFAAALIITAINLFAEPAIVLKVQKK